MAKVYDRVRQTFINVPVVSSSGFGDIASQKILGRNTAGTGAVEVLSIATVMAMLNIDAAIRFVINTQVEVTAPTVVGSILNVPAGTYTEFSAEVGCGESIHTATLQLKNLNTVLATINELGGLQKRDSASDPFTLTEVSTLDLVLFTDNAAAVAFLRGGYLK